MAKLSESGTKEILKGKEKGSRAWVRPAAIIFLAVLLLLTFFSNTIMNISMAEVETKQVKNGTISASIRGSGTVAASDTYSVWLYETREIQEVLIEAGDTVEAGDVLFVLDDSEGTELKTAQEMLADLELQYQQKLLSLDAPDYSADKSAIARLEQALANAKRERASYGAAKTTVAAATEALRLITIDVNEKTAEKIKLETALAALDEGDSGADSLKSQLSQATAELETAESKQRAAQNALENIVNISTAEDAVTAAEQALADANEALKEKMDTDTKQTAMDDLDIANLQKKIEDQKETVEKLTEKSVGTELIAKYGGIVTSVNAKAGETTTPMSQLAEIAVTGNGYSAEITLSKKQAAEIQIGDQAEVTSSTSKKTDVTATVEAIKDNLSGGAGDVSGGNAADSSGMSSGSSSSAETSGSSGASSSSSNSAETSGSASGGGTGKIIVLRLEGDVSIGESFYFTLKKASNSYDAVVPNGAVKTDSNGQFVLAITEKSSPLGIRYLATRLTVQVLDRDDTNSSVSGEIAPGDSIITTSSKAVEPGDYVRFAAGGGG